MLFQVNVPEADTTYWCSYYNLADFGVTDEVYVYRVSICSHAQSH